MTVGDTVVKRTFEQGKVSVTQVGGNGTINLSIDLGNSTITPPQNNPNGYKDLQDLLTVTADGTKKLNDTAVRQFIPGITQPQMTNLKTYL